MSRLSRVVYKLPNLLMYLCAIVVVGMTSTATRRASRSRRRSIHPVSHTKWWTNAPTEGYPRGQASATMMVAEIGKPGDWLRALQAQLAVDQHLHAAGAVEAVALQRDLGRCSQLDVDAMGRQAHRVEAGPRPLARLRHRPFPGGDRLRMPALVLGTRASFNARITSLMAFFSMRFLRPPNSMPQ